MGNLFQFRTAVIVIGNHESDGGNCGDWGVEKEDVEEEEDKEVNEGYEREEEDREKVLAEEHEKKIEERNNQ